MEKIKETQRGEKGKENKKKRYTTRRKKGKTKKGILLPFLITYANCIIFFRSVVGFFLLDS
jgi:hypothetical protein